MRGTCNAQGAKRRAGTSRPEDREKRMNLDMAYIGAHPAPGEEVMGMDDVDVDVRRLSVNKTSAERERMGEHD
jgi:hypothetical protein